MLIDRDVSYPFVLEWMYGGKNPVLPASSKDTNRTQLINLNLYLNLNLTL